MGTENHAARVVQVQEVLKHPNADTLGLVRICGYQVVVKLDEYKAGDLAVYIPPDSVVPLGKDFEWLWADKVSPGQEVPLKYRRITCRRFRKEWSEGLLHKIERDPRAGSWVGKIRDKWVTVGDDVAEYMGITHYDPPEPGEAAQTVGAGQDKYWPRSLKGWLYFLLRVLTFGFYDPNGMLGGLNERAPKRARPVYDVDAYKNHIGKFVPGEEVIVTEKIHGSNARFTYEPRKSLLDRLLLRPTASAGHLYAGSRKLWKGASGSIWRQVLRDQPWIEKWCREHPGYTLYGEVVPTQSGFNYGCGTGTSNLFVFDIRTPADEWMNITDIEKEFEGDAINWVPVLYRGPFDEDAIKKFVDGPSMRGAHMREGVVIHPVTERRVSGLGRLKLKIVSNVYLEEALKAAA